MRGNIEKWKISGDLVQDGTPSPESPIPIVGLGTPSVNLLDLANLEQGAIAVTTGLNGTTNPARVRSIDYITINAGVYTIKLNNAGSINIFYVLKYSLGNTFIEGIPLNVKSYTFTLTEATKLRFVFSREDIISNITPAEVQAALPQLQLGSTATALEPFGKYKVPVMVEGKNRFDPANLEQGNIDPSTGIPYSSAAGVRNLNYITLQSGTYIIKLNNASDFHIRRLYKYNLANVYTSYVLIGANVYSFTLTETTNIKITFIKNEGVTAITTAEVQAALPQLEEGSTATFYEPYVEPTITNIWTSQPLGRIGDAVDSVDSDGKERHELKKVIITSGSDWVYQFGSDTVSRAVYSDTSNKFTSLFYSENTRCNIASPVLTFVNIVKGKYLLRLNADSTNIYLGVLSTELSSLDNAGVQSWINAQIANHGNIEFYYPLSTPTENTIEVPRIEAKEGTSIIDAQTTEDYFILTESGDELVTENGDNLAILPSVTVAASTINAELWNSNY